MYDLSKQEIEFIIDDMMAQGITTESIRLNLLDHVCIIIEQNLGENDDFEKYYFSTIRKFYIRKLSEIENEAQILLRYKNHWALNRNQFFILLFLIFIGPFLGFNILWIDANWQSARWNIPFTIWGNTVAYALWPLLILLVIFLTPENLDPLIPRNSLILLGRNPLIKIVKAGCDEYAE
jgi:hypothetical protein